LKISCFLKKDSTNGEFSKRWEHFLSDHGQARLQDFRQSEGNDVHRNAALPDVPDIWLNITPENDTTQTEDLWIRVILYRWKENGGVEVLQSRWDEKGIKNIDLITK
jgi:hypothetical protein